jgi:hypothetical protein
MASKFSAVFLIMQWPSISSSICTAKVAVHVGADIYNIFRASTVLAVSLLALDYSCWRRTPAPSSSARSPFALLVHADVSWAACASPAIFAHTLQRQSADGRQIRKPCRRREVCCAD